MLCAVYRLVAKQEWPARRNAGDDQKAGSLNLTVGLLTIAVA